MQFQAYPQEQGEFLLVVTNMQKFAEEQVRVAGQVLRHNLRFGQQQVLGVFSNLDLVIEVCKRLDAHMTTATHSSLYKHKGEYCLLLWQETVAQDRIMMMQIMDEFGVAHGISELEEAVILEHGEILVKEGAIEKLASV
jgi:negative regulator of genetic competence, sporulation and motility